MAESRVYQHFVEVAYQADPNARAYQHFTEVAYQGESNAEVSQHFVEVAYRADSSIAVFQHFVEVAYQSDSNSLVFHHFVEVTIAVEADVTDLEDFAIDTDTSVEWVLEGIPEFEFAIDSEIEHLWYQLEVRGDLTIDTQTSLDFDLSAGSHISPGPGGVDPITGEILGAWQIDAYIELDWDELRVGAVFEFEIDHEITHEWVVHSEVKDGGCLTAQNGTEDFTEITQSQRNYTY